MKTGPIWVSALCLVGLMEGVGCSGSRPPCPTSLHWVDRIEGEIIIWDPAHTPDNIYPPAGTQEGEAFLNGKRHTVCTRQKRSELQGRRKLLERPRAENAAF